MKYLILMIIFCSSAYNVFAQDPQDTTQVETQTEVQLKQDTIGVEKKTAEELQTVRSENDKLKKRLLELSEIETKYIHAEEERQSIEKKKTEAEKRLISMASNFLYVPYEAYGVEKIAIKAFESVQNPELRRKYEIRYELLKNYRTHLIEFKLYLERVQKECKAPFQASATEFIDTTNPSVSPDLILKKQKFYLDYLKYDDYKETFIGKLILKTEALLKSHTKQNKANMQPIIKSIDSTLSPPEIDSVEKVISIIDERLKTVEDL